MDRPQLGGLPAIIVFLSILMAFTVQSDLIAYLESRLGFTKPYFLFYVGHSSFALVFPMHLLYLIITTKRTAKEYMSELIFVIHRQFSAQNRNIGSFPLVRVASVMFLMLLGLTGPGLLWYASVSLTSISDVTSLWNTNAFWAYVFTVQITQVPWERRKLVAVVVACLGVVAIVYGGTDKSTGLPTDEQLVMRAKRKSPILGSLIALCASIWYGLFQVFYKKVIALPNDPEVIQAERDSANYTPILQASVDIQADPEEGETTSGTSVMPPFGFHANFFLSSVGLLTILVLAIPFPILHYLNVERFALPPDLRTAACIALAASMGLIFNSGMMVLLGIWGPVMTSVGGLLTTLLVLVSDVLFVGGFGVLTPWNVLGAFMIIGGFAIMANEFRQHPFVAI